MRRPVMFLYSLLLPAIGICCSLFAAFLSGKRLGIAGTALFLMLVASLIGWLFARREGRDFSKSEYRNIILYCIGWLLLSEFLGLFYALSHSSTSPNLHALYFVIPFTVTLDSLFVWLAFRNFGRRVIRWYLAKHGKTLTCEKKDDVT